jgi:hypothetical protein
MGEPASKRVFRIVGWNETYETSESRKLKRLLWVAVPNKHDGLGFRRMAKERDHCVLFSAWILIVQIASKGLPEQRGWLLRDGRALDEEDMSLMTGFPAAVFERALKFFSDPKIGWLVTEGIADKPATSAGDGSRPVVPPERPAQPATPPGPSPDTSGDSAATGREDITGREVGQAPPSPPPEKETDEQWLDRLQESHPGVDVRLEAERALKKRQGEPFDRTWFEKSWLRNCSAQYGKDRQKKGQKAKEPLGWKTWWKMRHPAEVLPSAFDELPAAEQAAAWIELAGNKGKAA